MNLKTNIYTDTIYQSNMNPVEKTGNQKRIESCRLIGGQKKKDGHKIEEEFGKKYCNPSEITYKAEADKTITNEKYLQELKKELGVVSGRASIKSGNNTQFTLGKIRELENADNKREVLRRTEFWEKYVGKSESASPADVLVYRDEKRWIAFNMHHVVKFIALNALWRILNSGRIKGDFKDSSKKGSRQYLTYEYRKGKGYFLGANGNKGKPFIYLLMENLPHHIEED
jgi:hypothetical protein